MTLQMVQEFVGGAIIKQFKYYMGHNICQVGSLYMFISIYQKLFKQQRSIYPSARLQDLIKALHQAFLGCGHLIANEAGSFARLMGEWDGATVTGRFPEKLSEGFVRLHLGDAREKGLKPETVQRLFTLSAQIRTGQEEMFREALLEIRDAVRTGAFPADEEDRAFLSAYLPKVPAMLSHSEPFRQCYRPAYRVIAAECSALLPLLSLIDQRLLSGQRLTLAVEGGCASGKSSVAALLNAVYGAPVIPMDDFFLRPEQRTEERFREPGGNVDRERFLQEVAPYLRSGEAFSYRRFDCSAMALGENVSVPASPLIIVEGSYSMHPALAPLYDVSVFVTTDLEMRKKRILLRNGEKASMFFTRWMPLEEAYFEATEAEKRCTLRLTFPDTPFRIPLEEAL